MRCCGSVTSTDFRPLNMNGSVLRLEEAANEETGNQEWPLEIEGNR